MGFQLPTAQLVKIAWLLAINHMLDLFASEGSWVPWKNRPNADRRPSSYEERGAGDVRFRPADGSQPLGWNFRNLWVKPMETFALKVPPLFKKKWRNINVAENDLVPSWPSMWWRTSEKKKLPNSFKIFDFLAFVCYLFLLTVPVLIAISDWIRITMITGFETFNARLYRAAARRGSSTKCQDSKKDATQKGGEFHLSVCCFGFGLYPWNLMYPFF